MPAQRAMRHKPHETVHFTGALDLIADITGAIITADALHTVAGHARYLHARGAYGLFPVKENRPVLFAQLDGLDWDEQTNAAISMHHTEETNAGRHETRIVRVQSLLPGQVNFPYAAQALLAERYTTGRGDGKTHAVAELGVTTAPAKTAGAATLARCVRGQWAIEAQHFVRGVTFGEDACRARTGNLPPPPTTTTATTPPTPYANSVSQDEHASRLPSPATAPPGPPTRHRMTHKFGRSARFCVGEYEWKRKMHGVSPPRVRLR